VTYSAEEKRKCIEREMKMRCRIYPGWIEKGRMTADKAAHEMALMADIHQDYCTLAAKERLL
jgi:Fe-S-cluster containining protein